MINFFLKCSELFWNIISTIRRYPYPIVAYKIEINKLLNENNWNTASPKVEIKTVVETKPTENKTTWEAQEKPQEKKEIEGPKQIVNNEEKIENKPIENTTSNKKDYSWDFKGLRETVLPKLNKPTVQSNLKDQAIIEKKEWNILDITVITPLAKTLIGNEETKKLLEHLLSEELWENISIRITFIKKEDYLAQKMWL